MKRLAVVGVLGAGMLGAGVLGAGVLAAPAPARADAPGFADGYWTGDATLLGGAQYQGTFSYTITGGGCGFQLTIAGGKVTSGTISCSGTTEGDVKLPDRTLHVTTQEHANGPLTGPAGAITGTLDDVVTGTLEGTTASFTNSGSVTIKPDTLDCGVASGDLAAQWRAVQQAAGMDSTEQAIFYAVRAGTAGGTATGAAPPTGTQFTKLMSDLQSLTQQDPKKIGPDGYLLELRRLATAAATYLSSALKAASCPAGSAPSPVWRQDALAAAFQKAIEHAFIGPGGATFTLAQWGEILDLGLQTNAVVPPRSGPGTENALWDAIEGQLEQQLTAAVADHDQDAIFHVYVLAYGAGMTDLADQARKAMKP
jgi:hypothetical protein